MADTVSPEKRSKMMAGIGSKNTKPEILVRKSLHALGLRYRLHVRHLPGKPDLVFPKYHAVIFVHGCFWHGHNCALFRIPATRTALWQEKIERNRNRDLNVMANLTAMEWRVMTVWECALRGKGKLEFEEIISKCAQWLKGSDSLGEIRGKELK